MAPNALDRRFDVDQPNRVWVTDFTYVRTYEGWLYVTVVMDLFSRQVIGWSMKRNLRSGCAGLKKVLNRLGKKGWEIASENKLVIQGEYNDILKQYESMATCESNLYFSKGSQRPVLVEKDDLTERKFHLSYGNGQILLTPNWYQIIETCRRTIPCVT